MNRHQFVQKLVRNVQTVLVIGILSGCGTALPTEQTTSAGKLNVVTTVSPVTNIVYNIGGDKINLAGIVPEGVNSHTFEPAPSDVKTLADADIIFVNGLKLEEPTIELANANMKEGAELIELGTQTISEDAYVYDFSFPKEAGSPNPHLWPNPFHALRYAEIARDTLIKRDAVNADYYRQNYDAFKIKIEVLDSAIKATVASIPLENRKLLTYHDSWAYFSPIYGMTVVGAIQPADFSEPSAQEVAGLIKQIQAESVPAVFGSEVFASPVLEQIAKESGAVFVDDLRDDDLPGEPGEAQHSYIGLMVNNLKTMATGLGGDPTLMDSVDPSNVTGADAGVKQAQ